MPKTNNYHLRYLAADEYQLWDKFVLSSPQYCLFYTLGWANLIKEVFNRNFKILVLEKKEQIAAGILFWPKKVLFINAITHIPNTTFQGIVYRKPGASKASSVSSEYQKHSSLIIDHLIQNYQLIDIPLSPAIHDARPFSWKQFTVQTAYTYRFEITEFEKLQQQFSQDLRRKIKKAEDLHISLSASKETAALTRFIDDSYKESSLSPAISSALIKEFMDMAIKMNIGMLFYQFENNEPISGIFVLKDDYFIYALFSGISGEKRNVTNNELLHAFVLNQPEFTGKQFDFLGANTPHLEQFKRSFGGDLVPYFKVNFKKNKSISSLFYARSKFHIAKRKFKSFY